jgi:hypothetical protein
MFGADHARRIARRLGKIFMTIDNRKTARAVRVISASLAMTAALATGGAATAQMQMQMTQGGDATLTCEQLAAEVARMDQAMVLANNAIAGADGAARAADLGASLGMEAALRSGALTKMPGLGRFASLAASAAKQAAASKAEQGAQNIQIAQQRRAIMSGLYQGRACGSAPVATPVSMTMTTTTTAAPAAPASLAATQDVSLRVSAAPTAAIVGTVRAGGAIYPTGNRNGVWMEVDDENGARGWMSSAFAKPR